MACDFGAIPMPNSPMQDYFERRLKSSSDNATPLSPQSPKSERSIEAELARALADVAKQQAAEKLARANNTKVAPRDDCSFDASPERRGSSASSTGYTAFSSDGHLKRRSLACSTIGSQAPSRRPSR